MNTYYIKSAADDVRNAMATLEQHIPSGIEASKILRDSERTLNLESLVAPTTLN
jgi:type II secretory pathway component PulM